MKAHQKEDSRCVGILRAIKKYKWENIKELVLIEGLTKEQANYWEKHYIAIFDSFHNGYNLTSGGDSYEISQITRDRMVATQNRPEVKANNAARMMGNTYGLGNTNAKGKRTPEQIENIKIGTEQGRRRAFIANGRGWKHTPEFSARMMGNTYGLGYKHTDELRAGMMGNQRAKGKRSAEARANIKAGQNSPEVRAKNSAMNTGQNNPMSATNRRRRFIAKCFDGGVYNWY